MRARKDPAALVAVAAKENARSPLTDLMLSVISVRSQMRVELDLVIDCYVCRSRKSANHDHKANVRIKCKSASILFDQRVSISQKCKKFKC